MLNGYSGFAMVQLFATIIYIVLTVVAFGMVISEHKSNSLPEKIILSCNNCNSKNLSLHTQKINPKTTVQSLIKFNLIWLTISLSTSIMVIIITLFKTDEMFTYLFENQNFIKDSSQIIRTITIHTEVTKYQFIITAINILLNLISFGIKKDAVITICKDCGNVTSYFNENID